jgi:hypothetical protein
MPPTALWRDAYTVSDRQERWIRPGMVLDALYSHLGWIDGDVFRIDDNTWAIHGVIPVDGDVILAEFGKREDARAVLERLTITESGESTP